MRQPTRSGDGEERLALVVLALPDTVAGSFVSRVPTASGMVDVDTDALGPLGLLGPMGKGGRDRVLRIMLPDEGPGGLTVVGNST